MTQIIDEVKEDGIQEENIVYINFESLKYDFIKNAKDLCNYIESLITIKDIYYIFFDILGICYAKDCAPYANM